MSIIALIAISLFIATGFILDIRENDKVTNAVWIPFIWMVICGSRSINQWINLGQAYTNESFVAASLSGSIIDQIFLSLFIVIGLFIIFSRKVMVTRLILNNMYIVIFIVYLGLSFLWADDFFISFRKWIRLFGYAVMTVVIMSEQSPLNALRSIFRRTSYVLIPLSVYMIKYLPIVGVSYSYSGIQMWNGVTTQKNNLGHLCLVVTFFLIWDLIYSLHNKVRIERKRLYIDSIIFFTSIYLLKGPGGQYSSTSIGALLMSVVLLLVLEQAKVKKYFASFGYILVISSIIVYYFESVFGIMNYIVVAMGRNMTFTDRVPLWDTLIDYGLDRPIFGYGYGGFWSPDRVSLVEEKAGLFYVAHNGYLELFLDGGAIAVTLVVLMLTSVLNKINKYVALDYDYGCFRLCFFMMILLANMTESCFARERDLLTYVFFIIAFIDKPYCNANFVIKSTYISRGLCRS